MKSKLNNCTSQDDLLPAGQRQPWKTAPSLKPGIEMMDGCLRKHAESLAIRDAWKGPTVNPISAHDQERLDYASSIVFEG